MIIDQQAIYSDAQELVASGASTNLIDHTAGAKNEGMQYEILDVYISLDTAADAGTGDETYTATLQTDTDKNFGSPKTVGAPVSIPRGSAAGSHFFIPIPPQPGLMKQYSRVYYTLGGTTPDITVTAFLTPRSMNNNEPQIDYPIGYTIAS